MDVHEKAKKIEKKALARTKLKKVESITEIIQLPIWPETTRGFPNVIARTALFNARRPSMRREMFRNLPISSVSGVSITYSGEELRQDDQTVLMQLIHLTQHQPFTESVQFTPYSFLKSIGWSTNNPIYYDKLLTIMERLSVTGIRLTSGELFYIGSLVRKIAGFDKKTGDRLRIWKAWLEPEIIELFKSGGYCLIAWEQRTALNKPLAQWLQAYYSTHKEPYLIKIETIRDLSGSTTVLLWKFKQTLKNALDELVKVGFLMSYSISKQGLIQVKKSPVEK